MNDTLKNILRKDETVLWAGAPEPVEVLEKPHVPLLIVRWAVCAVLGVLLIAYLTYFSVYVFQVENQARIVVGVVLAACIFVALRPFMDARGLPKRVCFAVTDQRFILYRRNGDAFDYRELTDMTEATVEALPTGAYNFFIGPVTNSLRRSTHLNVTEYREDAKLDPLVFASVADIQGLLRVLPSYITVHGAPAAAPERAA